MITKTYDLILWSCNHTSEFPRNHRFVLGERIEWNLWAARNANRRQVHQESSTLAGRGKPNLESLRFQMRLAKDLQCLKIESYAFAAKSIDEVGRLVGGGLRQIHRRKSVAFPCDRGIRFLGFRVFPTHRLLAQENVRRFRRRRRWMQRACAAGRVGFDAIRPRIMSWIGHARHANTYRLRSDLFRRMIFQRAGANPSSASGRGV